MAELELHTEPSVTNLVSGILSDAQTLIRQQADMLRAEVRQDVRRTAKVAMYMGVGVGLGAIGALFLLVGLVHLVGWVAPELPDWASWAIVGGVLAVVGAAAVFAGKRLFDTFNPLPDKTFNALQENLSWITKRQS